MKAFSALIPELDALTRPDQARRRADVVAQLGDLFVRSALGFDSDQVELFDQVLTGLVPSIDTDTRAVLAGRLAALANAPPSTIGRLARDSEIRVAGPVLRLSPLVEEQALIDIARTKSQPHLLAIAARSVLSEPLADVILRRGERNVIRRIAANDGARLSSRGYARLLEKANTDGILAVVVGRRDDITPARLRTLVEGAVTMVRHRIIAAADPDKQTEIGDFIAEIRGEIARKPVKRDFTLAQRALIALHRSGGLAEPALRDFAKGFRYEESVATLAALSGLPIDTVDRLMTGESLDLVLLLARATELEWTTTRALLKLRAEQGQQLSTRDMTRALAKFEQLSCEAALHVVQLWRREGSDARR